MLPEWYFCCCVESSPDKTLAFLSILETLDNPESSPELLYLAHEELERTDVWMRIYAIPNVLRSMHRNERADIAAVISAYFSGLHSILPEEIKDAFERLLDPFFSEKSVRTKMNDLESCTQTALSLLPERKTTQVPYLDLKEFLPETLLLAMVLDQLKHDRDFASPLALDLQEGSSSLSALIENALRCSFGRLNFLTAARIAGTASERYSENDILSLISKCPYSTIDLEPDLMEIYAEARYLNDAGQTDPEQRSNLAEEVVEETMVLDELRRLISMKPQLRQGHETVLRRLGFQIPHPRLRYVLPIIYWQASLADIALRIDSQVAVHGMAKYWTAPDYKNFPDKISVTCPKGDHEIWEKQLVSLLSLRNIKRKALVRVRRGEVLSFLPDSKWIFFSPWLHRESGKSRQRTHATKQQQYPEAGDPIFLTRLIASAITAIKMLQTLAIDDPAYEVVAPLVAHASDVLTATYSGWLLNFAEGDSSRDAEEESRRDPDGEPRRENRRENRREGLKLSPEMTGLALFGRRQIGLAGRGHFESIPPDGFVDLLSRRNRTSETEDARNFNDVVLPGVIISWIMNAYPSGVGSTGSGRWLVQIPYVYPYCKGNQHTWKSRITSSLVMRFLSGDSEFEAEDDLDWRQAKRNVDGGAVPLEWLVQPRQLLLARRNLSPDEWLRSGWSEPNWDDSGLKIEELAKRQAIRLVRSLERLASLKHPGSISDEIRKEWRREWRDLLNAVGHTKDLDRFVRLRLIEFLDDPELKADQEGQELIALVLLENGCIYDLKRMFDSLYPLDEGGSPKPVNAARKYVQESLLNAVHTKLKQLETLLLSETSNRGAQDPRVTLINLYETELLRNTISKIGFYGRSKDQHDDLTNLAARLRELRSRSLKRSIGSPLREVKANIQFRGDQRCVVFPQGVNGSAQEICEVALRAMVFDVNNLTATLLYDDYDTDGVLNLFKKRTRAVNPSAELSTESPVDVIAIVAHISRARDGRINCVFNCGPRLLKYEYDPKNKDRVAVGDFVSLPIKTIKRVDKSEWIVSEIGDHQIRRLKRRLWTGDLDSVSVRESWDRNRRKLSVKRHDNIIFHDPMLWEADVSRSFRPLLSTSYSAVFAVFTEGKWVPQEGGLTDLLLSVFTRQDISVAVLTLIETKISTSTSWLFSSSPGENYRLYERDLVLADAAELKEASRDSRNSRGLLVAVTPVVQDGTVRLRLIREVVRDQQIEALYPHMQFPFDLRNIKWREFFSMSHIAEREQARWYVRVESEIAGYPERIRVEWQKPTVPKYYDTQAEFIPVPPSEKNWREPILYGYTVKLNEIRSRSTWEDFFSRWENLQRFARVHLHNAIGGIRDDGYIECFTDENIRLLVEAESLSMRPFQLNEFPEIGNSRVAEIYRVDWQLGSVLTVNPDEVPQAAIEGGKCRGFFIEVPKSSDAGGKYCKILWKTGDSVILAGINIDNISRAMVKPMWKIIGERRDADFRFHAEKPRFLARALWTLQENALSDGTICYLGTVSYAHQIRHVAERTPGSLILLSSVPEDIQYLAKGDGDTFRLGLRLGTRTSDIGKSPKWKEGRSEYRRAKLLINNDILAGVCEAKRPQKDISLSGIWLRLDDRKEDNLFSLRREFRLVDVSERVTSSGVSSVDKVEAWEKRLSEYLEKPEDLDAIYQDGVLTLEPLGLKVPIDEARRNWSYQVPILPEEKPYVSECQYTHHAKVRLFERDCKVLASFRMVPPYTPEDFMETLHARFHEIVFPEHPLYYAGYEAVTIDEDGGNREFLHRFEWGYGKTLLVPERKLMYNDGPFNRSQFILFYGDSISGITFLPDESTEAVSDKIGNEPCLIQINELNLQFSQGRSLYHQKRDHKIIHVLHLERQDDMTLRIMRVEGFDERRIQNDPRFFHKDTQYYERSRAQFSSEDHAGILRQFSEADWSEKEVPKVLGRFDDTQFRDTLGKEVYFEHVRLSFYPGAHGSPLRDGELVFLKAGEMIPSRNRNDVGLHVSHVAGLSKEDVGSDCADIRVLRRKFSAREDCLWRIYRGNLKETIKGSLLLVRLTRENSSRVHASLTEKIPPRRSKALADAVSRKSGPFLATICSVSEGRLKIEIRPGIFVTLEWDQIENIPGSLDKGTIIRVEYIAASKHFRVIQASFPDTRYVADHTRTAVALPMDRLLNERLWDEYDVGEDRYWKNKRLFTIGGLPNLTACPAFYEWSDCVWKPPKAKELIGLMETEHPKVVRVGRDPQGQIMICPVPLDEPVGRLECSDTGHGVRYAKLAPSLGTNGSYELEWRLLSFGDESAADIKQRADQIKWKYHDVVSGVWKERHIQKTELDTHDVWTGPLFFERIGSDLRLRYSGECFLRFGFPASELFQVLSSLDSYTFPIAGISDAGGIWIEAVPGRIMELPEQLVVWEAKSEEKPISNFHWAAFAPGDRVELKLISPDPMTPDHVALKKWIPGPRRAFGPSRCLLPVGEYNENEGSVMLGMGEFSLILPMTRQPDEGWRVLALYPDNTLQCTDRHEPQPGDVVLVGMDKSGRPAVLGFPELTPWPAREFSEWEKDPIAEDLLSTSDKDAFRFDIRKLGYVIRAAGGALPFTVEFCSAKGNLFLSRRHQQAFSAIPANKVIMARPLGLLADEQTALLKCGSALAKMRMDEIISGLPIRFFAVAMQALKRSGISVWIRTTGDCSMRIGFHEDHRPEIFVELIDIAFLKQSGDSDAGLICRSLDSDMLYWLPASKAAWAPLSADQLGCVFASPRRTIFKAKIISKERKTDALSIVELKEVDNEFKSLFVGSKLTVRPVESIGVGDDGTVRYLAESHTTGIVLYLETFDSPQVEIGKPIPVEVIRLVQGDPCVVIVVPIGRRKLFLDLPSWMTKRWPDPGDVRTKVKDWQIWISGRIDTPPAIQKHELRELDDGKVEEYLCLAYTTIDEGIEYLPFQVQMAREWIRRFANKAEIDAVFALIAIILLQKNGCRKERDIIETLGHGRQAAANLARKWKQEWRQEAFEIVRDLGRRAFRSMHVETLLREWLNSYNNRTRSGEMWNRLQKVETILSGTIRIQHINAVRRFCHAVEMRNPKVLTTIAEALSASIGEILNPAEFLLEKKAINNGDYPETIVTRDLIRISRTLPSDPSADTMDLTWFQEKKLTELLKFIIIRGLDLTLLDPLPWANKS